jgi:hypothetical protein
MLIASVYGHQTGTLFRDNRKNTCASVVYFHSDIYTIEPHGDNTDSGRKPGRKLKLTMLDCMHITDNPYKSLPEAETTVVNEVN